MPRPVCIQTPAGGHYPVQPCGTHDASLSPAAPIENLPAMIISKVQHGYFLKWLTNDKNICKKRSDLRVEVLLKFQLLFQSLDAILSIHPPQHLILQLLLGIGQAGIQLKKKHKMGRVWVQSNAAEWKISSQWSMRAGKHAERLSFNPCWNLN